MSPMSSMSSLSYGPRLSDEESENDVNKQTLSKDAAKTMDTIPTVQPPSYEECCP